MGDNEWDPRLGQGLSFGKNFDLLLTGIGDDYLHNMGSSEQDLGDQHQVEAPNINGKIVRLTKME